WVHGGGNQCPWVIGDRVAGALGRLTSDTHPGCGGSGLVCSCPVIGDPDPREWNGPTNPSVAGWMDHTRLDTLVGANMGERNPGPETAGGGIPSLRTDSGRLAVLAGPDFRIVLVEFGPDPGDDRVEGLGIVDGQLGQALPVQADLGKAEPM